MNTWLRVLTLLIGAGILQASSFREIRVGGTGVELLLLISVLSGYHGGPLRGAVSYTHLTLTTNREV